MIDRILEHHYNNTITFTGRDSFYDYICQKYVGISRTDVMNFLKRQKTYQLHQPLIKSRTHNPIIATRPLSRIQMDLTDMSKISHANSGNNWLLVLIDVFSKFVWCYPIKDKTARSVKQALVSHFSRNPWPSVLQSDNGSEFKGVVEIYVASQQQTKYIHSAVYSPHSQGIVERFNKTLKQRLFAYMTQHKTKRYIEVLQPIVNTYNNMKHSAHGYTPRQAYNDITIRPIVLARLKKLTKKYFSHRPPTRLKRGDLVRVSFDSVSANRRSLTKFKKSYTPNWINEIYTIRSVSSHVNTPFYLIERNGILEQQQYGRHQLQEVQRPNDSESEEESDSEDNSQTLALPSPSEPKPKRVIDPLKILNTRIAVYWKDKRRWFKGLVLSYQIGRRTYLIRYDDGLFPDGEDHEIYEDLAIETWKKL